MPIDKIAIVVIFLLTLLLLQLVIKYRGKVKKVSFPGANNNNINVTARLSLSKTDRADLISVGSQSFMIIFAKGSSPAVVELASDTQYEEQVLVK